MGDCGRVDVAARDVDTGSRQLSLDNMGKQVGRVSGYSVAHDKTGEKSERQERAPTGNK